MIYSFSLYIYIENTKKLKNENAKFSIIFGIIIAYSISNYIFCTLFFNEKFFETKIFTIHLKI